MAFHSFKTQFERDIQKYENIVERNKTNGMLGGRPKKENPKKPKKADSDSDSVSDSDNKKVISKKILFKNSEFIDKHKFKAALEGWSNEKLAYYYESLLAWSNEGNKKIDWIATARQWAARDEREGKVKFANAQTLPDWRSGKVRLTEEQYKSLSVIHKREYNQIISGV